MVGYVMKEGNLVGLCVFEYIVDMVLYFEGDMYLLFWFVCVFKNCFGVVNEFGVFVMIECGLCGVVNLFVLFLL